MATLTDNAGARSETRRVDRLLTHYAQSHMNPVNERIHFVAIPLIALSLVGLLYAAHPWAAYAVVGASLLYYARLSIVFLASMAAMGAMFLAVAHLMGERALALSAIIFVGAWIAQFVGHKIEGKKPSFFEDLQYLLVGPIFVLAKLYARLGIRW
jgi:uncharacterized membrane protein YGL010W